MTYRDENGNERRPTREECVEEAAQVFATMRDVIAQMTPREQAEAAWTPTSKFTVNELEQQIRVERGLTPKRREGAEPT